MYEYNRKLVAYVYVFFLFLKKYMIYSNIFPNFASQTYPDLFI